MQQEEQSINKDGEDMKSFVKWLQTFTKRAVALILAVSLIDLQLSYILAFLGRDEIAEKLSTTIVEMIIGVMIGYFCKALFETYFEKREERLNKEIENEINQNGEENDPSDNWDDEDIDQS